MYSSPNYDGVPVYVPFLNAAIHIGSFLQWEDHTGNRAIGRLIRPVSNTDSFEINIYNKISTSSPLLAQQSLRHLQQIQQTEDDVLVPIASIQEIAFVLSVEEFQSHVITVSAEFTNVFLIRWTTTQAGSAHFAFPSKCRESGIFAEHCLAKTIILDLRNIRTAIHKSMNRVSQIQSDAYKDMTRVALSLHTWNYLLRNLHESTPFPSRTHIQILEMFAARFRKRVTRTCSLIRNETLPPIAIAMIQILSCFVETHVKSKEQHS